MDGIETAATVTLELTQRPKILGGVSESILKNIKFIGAKITATKGPHNKPDDNAIARENNRDRTRHNNASWGIVPNDNCYRVTVKDLLQGCEVINDSNCFWNTFKGSVNRLDVEVYYIPKLACKEN